ncbi:MAG: glycine zipper 2TM domain-containing protein [Betaproteobacteria bacterium]|nr:glycine zipper 2TM domain-containing protein [Betaproteobacteria bacterium]
MQVPVQGTGSSVGGAVAGSVIGAALGNQVGRGDGKTVATAVGAVLGSQLGAQQPQASGYELRNVCNNVPVQIQQGEIVTFEYRGRRFSHQFP